MTDLEYGRAWAAMMGKQPAHRKRNTVQFGGWDEAWVWGYDSSWGWFSPAVAEKAFIPNAVFNEMGGQQISRSEAEAYAALGAAVRAIHAAVPHLAGR